MISTTGMNKISMARAIFWIFLLGYIGLILAYPRLGPSDEYAFLPTLQSGKSFPMYGVDFPYYNSAEIGRFSPLAGQEYNLAAFFSNTPFAYFLLNVIQLVVFVLSFLSILSHLSISKERGYWALILLLLLPAATLTFFKLLYIDKTVLTLMAVALAAHIGFQVHRKPVFFLLALIAANLALYYKEPVFALVATYAAAHLWLGRRTLPKSVLALDALWIASAIVYLVIYMIAVMPHRGAQIYGQSQIGSAALTFVKNMANYAFFSDPIIILCLFPLAAYRVVAVLLKRAVPHPVLDAMLLGGVGYAAVFLVLNMYSPYYMLPVYLFALPPLLYFIGSTIPLGWFWKGALGLTIFVLVVDTIPLGIHYLSYNKYVPLNFDATLNFLVSDINKRYSGERLNIYFDGVDRGTGRGVYFVVGEYLKFKGLPIRKFDLRSDVAALQSGPFVGKRSPFDSDADVDTVDPAHAYAVRDFPFAVFQPGTLSKPQRGDYLIVSPHSTKDVDEHYLAALNNDYDLVFHTESRFAVPRVTLKTAAKYLMMHMFPEQKNGGLIINENLMNWPDYYVFIKR